MATKGFGDFLKTGKSKARIKRFRGRDMQTQMVELTQAAAIIRSVYFEQMPQGTPEQQKQHMKDSILNAEGYGRKRIKKKNDTSTMQDRLEEIIDQVERGYPLVGGALPGQPPGKPYERSFEERPKIRIAGRPEQPNP